MEESLDRIYLTVEDLLNSKHTRYNDVEHARTTDTLHFHFNKPGFDLAIILTDKSLIPTISEFQIPFHTKHGLTSHVIYLPDVTRLKYCIRDLKLHEILYAIVVTEDSRRTNEYDLYLLSEYIEFQQCMKYDDAVNLIDADYTNYMQQVKAMWANPVHNPHARNESTEGFLEPSDRIRYLLCLLFDHRMLSEEELRLLGAFVQKRKEAILRSSNRSIKYGIDDRPVPPYRQDKLKYFVYEHKQELNYDMELDYNDEKRKGILPIPSQMKRNDIPVNHTDFDGRYPSSSATQQRILKNQTVAMPLGFNPKLPPPMNPTIGNKAIISASPKLYSNSNGPTIGPNAANAAIKGTTPVKNLFVKTTSTKTAIQSQANIVSGVQSKPSIGTTNAQTTKSTVTPGTGVIRPPGNNLAPVPMMRPPGPVPGKPIVPVNKPSRLATPIPSPAQVPATSRIKFAITPVAKPPPVTHSNVAHKPQSATNVAPARGLLNNKQQPPSRTSTSKSHGERSKSVDSTHSDPLSDFERDNPTVEYNLSPASDDEAMDTPSKRDSHINIDLTDDVIDSADASQDSCSPAKKPKYSTNEPATMQSSQPSPIVKSTQPSTYVLNLSEEHSSLEPKTCTMNSARFISLFKFILNLAPLGLPDNNAVIVLIKKSLQDMEKYTKACGHMCPTVNIQACRTSGCSEILKIIEGLCGETIAAKHCVSDLNFMWTYFPRNMSDHSVTVMFYKLMKMLESCKLVAASNSIIISLLEQIERVTHCNFQLTNSKPISYPILNFFSSLFPEYFSQQSELHSLNITLPPPEPTTASFNPDFDRGIIENKIKFVVGPVLDLFIQSINSVHHELDMSKMEVIYGAIRTARFCLRKISVRLLPEPVSERVQFSESVNIIEIMTAEFNSLVLEVKILNCILFTRRHYDFVNVMLDFAIQVKHTVEDGTDPDMDFPDKECLVHFDPRAFLKEFSTTIKTAVLAYHPDTEIDVFKAALRNRWIDTLHQAFKGLPPLPEGGRIADEMEYLLPKIWSKPTFSEAVSEAASLCYSDWDKMLTNDFGRARIKYSDVRNNYLLWLSNNRLEHRKATEAMTSFQKTLDVKILEMSS